MKIKKVKEIVEKSKKGLLNLYPLYQVSEFKKNPDPNSSWKRGDKGIYLNQMGTLDMMPGFSKDKINLPIIIHQDNELQIVGSKRYNGFYNVESIMDRFSDDNTHFYRNFDVGKKLGLKIVFTSKMNVRRYAEIIERDEAEENLLKLFK